MNRHIVKLGMDYFLKRIVTIVVGVLMLQLTVNELQARGLPADTKISNKATANYTDDDNNSYSTSTDAVDVIVAEVCGVDATDGPISITAIDGQTKDIAVSIENIGNGENTFNLTENAAQFTTNIYLDSDQNGKASAAEKAAGTIAAITLGADVTGHIVLQVTADSGAAGSEAFTLTITGTLPAGCNDTLSITTTIVNDAQFTFTKTPSVLNANSGDDIQYTIDFKNTGTKSAKSEPAVADLDGNDQDGILVYDSIPAGTTYKASSASGSPMVSPAGFLIYSTNNRGTWVSAPVPAAADITDIGFFMPDGNPTGNDSEAVLVKDQEGDLVFTVTVNTPFNDTDGKVDNVATMLWRPDDGLTPKMDETGMTTTTVPDANAASISAGGTDDDAASNASGDSWEFSGGLWTNTGAGTPVFEEDIEADAGDVDTPDSFKDDNYANLIPAGETVEFRHQVRNNSVISDVINVSAINTTTTLPAGASVTFWDSTGSTQLGNSNSGTDSLDDVGTVAALSTKDFVVKIFIPISTGGELLDETIDWFVDIQASSANNSSITDLSRDNIDGIIAAGADVGAANTAGVGGNDGSDGNTDGTNDSDDITTGTVVPGNTITYPIHIVNSGGSPDSYSLATSGVPTGATATFLLDPDCDGVGDSTATATPILGATTIRSGSSTTVLNVFSTDNFVAGETVVVNGTEIRTIDSVSPTNNTITLDSAVVPAPTFGQSLGERYCVVLSVEVDNNAGAVDGNIVVTATGGSGQSDGMDVAIEIQQTCLVGISPSSSNGQLPDNGTSTYSHTITNNSNFTGFVRIDLIIPTPPAQLAYIFIAKGAGWFHSGDDGNVGGAGVNADVAKADGEAVPLNKPYIQLAPGASASFEVQVSASGVLPLTENVTIQALLDVDGEFSGGTNCTADASESSEVVNGLLSLTKTPTARDSHTVSVSTDPATCSNGADTITGGPCDEIFYSIRYQNLGDKDAKSVSISDQIPDKTTYVAGSADFDANCDGTGGDKPGDNTNDMIDDSGATIIWTFDDDIASGGEFGCVIFEVTINADN